MSGRLLSRAKKTDAESVGKTGNDLKKTPEHSPERVPERGPEQVSISSYYAEHTATPPKVGKLEKPVNFVFDEIFTYGLTNGKYEGYSLPINLPQDSHQTDFLLRAAEDYGVTLKIYGRGDIPNTMYLKCDQLNKEQREELLAKRNMIVRVAFEATAVFEQKDGTLGFRFRVTELWKVKPAERLLAPAPQGRPMR